MSMHCYLIHSEEHLTSAGLWAFFLRGAIQGGGPTEIGGSSLWGGGELLGCLRLYYEIFEKLQYPASNAKKLIQHVKTIAGNPPGLTRNFKNLSKISFLSRIKF